MIKGVFLEGVATAREGVIIRKNRVSVNFQKQVAIKVFLTVIPLFDLKLSLRIEQLHSRICNYMVVLSFLAPLAEGQRAIVMAW